MPMQKSNKPEISVEVPLEVFLPCYRDLLPSNLLVDENGDLIYDTPKKLPPEPDIDFLWGGRDSGKTRHVAMRLIIDCMTLPYFRCILVRKVFNTIHDSQWQQIKDICHEWGVEHLFKFKESPLEIECVENGNKFICRGMDDPGKVKSVSNPSHCWVEEGNQLEKEDFIIIMTSLRTNTGRVKTWVSFNPECEGDFKDFWMYKMFFAPHEGSYYGRVCGKWEHKIPPTSTVGYYSKERTIYFKYRCTWTTYKDNPYCRPERVAFLLQNAAFDKYYATVFTNGLWGNRKVGDPFCYCYDEKKHKRKCQLDRRLELILSFDFNVNPITCGVYQHIGNEIRCIQSIKMMNSNIYELCGYIKVHYPGFMFLVTGDATGRNTSALVKDNINYYTVIRQELSLGSAQIKTPSINPPVQENRVLVNAVLMKMNVSMDPDNCKELIFDCENVSVDEMGKIDKGDRANPIKRADHLDHFRYYLNTFHKGVLKMLT